MVVEALEGGSVRERKVKRMQKGQRAGNGEGVG